MMTVYDGNNDNVPVALLSQNGISSSSNVKIKKKRNRRTKKCMMLAAAAAAAEAAIAAASSAASSTYIPSSNDKMKSNKKRKRNDHYCHSTTDASEADTEEKSKQQQRINDCNDDAESKTDLESVFYEQLGNPLKYNILLCQAKLAGIDTTMKTKYKSKMMSNLIMDRSSIDDMVDANVTEVNTTKHHNNKKTIKHNDRNKEDASLSILNLDSYFNEEHEDIFDRINQGSSNSMYNYNASSTIGSSSINSLDTTSNPKDFNNHYHTRQSTNQSDNINILSSASSASCSSVKELYCVDTNSFDKHFVIQLSSSTVPVNNNAVLSKTTHRKDISSSSAAAKKNRTNTTDHIHKKNLSNIINRQNGSSNHNQTNREHTTLLSTQEKGNTLIDHTNEFILHCTSDTAAAAIMPNPSSSSVQHHSNDNFNPLTLYDRHSEGSSSGSSTNYRNKKPRKNQYKDSTTDININHDDMMVVYINPTNKTTCMSELSEFTTFSKSTTLSSAAAVVNGSNNTNDTHNDTHNDTNNDVVMMCNDNLVYEEKEVYEGKEGYEGKQCQLLIMSNLRKARREYITELCKIYKIDLNALQQLQHQQHQTTTTAAADQYSEMFLDMICKKLIHISNNHYGAAAAAENDTIGTACNNSLNKRLTYNQIILKNALLNCLIKIDRELEQAKTSYKNITNQQKQPQQHYIIHKSGQPSQSASASAAVVIKHNPPPPPILIAPNDVCPQCNISYDFVMSSATMQCHKCGKMQQNIDAITMTSHGRENDNSFHYKRINHFNEYLLLFQAKETTQIAKPILKKVINHIHTVQKCNDKTKITKDMIRQALKSLGYRKYYENEAQILFMLTGIRPPQMTHAQEERCRLRFSAVQGPFKKHCPNTRKNFFSYPHVLYKFCEMDGWFEFLPCFRLHKGAQKREFLDTIWKKICDELDGADCTMTWKFMKTPLPGQESVYYQKYINNKQHTTTTSS